MDPGAPDDPEPPAGNLEDLPPQLEPLPGDVETEPAPPLRPDSPRAIPMDPDYDEEMSPDDPNGIDDLEARTT